MLTGISRTQRYRVPADTHGVSPARGQRGGHRAGQRGRRQSCPTLTPHTPGQPGREGRPPRLPRLPGTPRARSSKAGGRGSPVVPTAAVSHTPCPTRRWPSKADQQAQRLGAAQASPGRATHRSTTPSRYCLLQHPLAERREGRSGIKLTSLFPSAFCFYDMNRSKAMVRTFYIILSSSKPINQ